MRAPTYICGPKDEQQRRLLWIRALHSLRRASTSNYFAKNKNCVKYTYTNEEGALTGKLKRELKTTSV